MQYTQFLSKAVYPSRIHRLLSRYYKSSHFRTLYITLLYCCSMSHMDRPHTCHPQILELSSGSQCSCESTNRIFGSWDSSCIPNSLSQNILDGNNLCMYTRSRMFPTGIYRILNPYRNTILSDILRILISSCYNIGSQDTLRISSHWTLEFHLDNQRIFVALCHKFCFLDTMCTFL